GDAHTTDASLNQHFGGLILPPQGGSTYSNFRFDPDYQVDLIFWKSIVGQVTNAIYLKPWLSYDFVREFGFRVDMIHSMAHIPVAIPGHGRNYGLEFDFSLGYKNEKDGFFAGLQSGFFVPMGALDHSNAELFSPTASTGVAQILRTSLRVQF